MRLATIVSFLALAVTKLLTITYVIFKNVLYNICIYRAAFMLCSSTGGCIWWCVSSRCPNPSSLFVIQQTLLVIVCWQFTNITNITIVKHYSRDTVINMSEKEKGKNLSN